MSTLTTFFFVSTVFIIFDVILYNLPANNVDLLALKTELEANIFQQKEALASIFTALDQLPAKEGAVILNIVGGTGVGKTFAANIVKRHFDDVEEFTGPLANKAEEFERKINKTAPSLVIFDDLTVKDTDKLLLILKKLPRDLRLVICVFNIQETEDLLSFNVNFSHIDAIESKLSQAEIAHYTARFREFTTEDALEWINKQLVAKKMNPVDFKQKIVSVLSSQNVQSFGLKGLGSKISLESYK